MSSSPRTMRNTLRSPRSPTRNVSSVELTNLSASQLPSQTSSEIHHPSSELHHTKDPQSHPQKLNPYVPFAVKNGWFFAKIILRSLSFIFALIILCIQLSFFIPVHDFGNIISVILVFFFSAAIIIWDSCEFITLCARRGFGIHPKAHIGLDLVLWLGSVVGSAAIFFEFDFMTLLGYNNLWGDDVQSKLICSLVMFISLVVIHFILFVRACVDKKRGIGATPKIMYLPTGEAVVVVPRPVPPMPTRRYTKESNRSPTRQLSQVPSQPTTTTSPPPLPSLSHPLPPLPLDQYSQTTTPISSDAPTLMTPVPPTQQNQPPPPRRKPLPVRGTHYANPWDAPGPGYEPDADEIARAERGERQAQYMALDGIDTARVTRMDGPREKFLAGEANKLERRKSL